MKQAQKILLIQTSFIGDVILATAALEQLHEQWPNARIDILVRKGVEGLFDGHPFLNAVLTWDKSKPKVRSLRKLIKIIRSEQYDQCITLHRFASSGFLCAFSGAEVRAGFDKNPLSRLFTHKAPHQFDGRHEVERNASLISMLGEMEDFAPKPRLYPSREDREKVANWMTDTYVCIAPTSVWATKAWPAAKWAEFMEQLPDDTQVYLLGGPSDHAACEAIIALSKHEKSINLCGALSLLQSAALMKGAAMNYSNDSAPMHLASAVDAPITAIYCSTVPAFGFGPLSTKSRVVESKALLGCRPCGLHGHKACPESHFKCATTIDVDQLL